MSERVKLAWGYVAGIIWDRLPYPFCIDSRIGCWLLAWSGFYAFHPMHDKATTHD